MDRKQTKDPGNMVGFRKSMSKHGWSSQPGFREIWPHDLRKTATYFRGINFLFENLFLGSLLVFLCSIWTQEGKKKSISNVFVPSRQKCCVVRKEGGEVGHEGQGEGQTRYVFRYPSVKHSSDESKKSFFSRKSRFVSCGHTPIRTWSTNELRPSLHTQVHDVCVHSWNKMVTVTYTNKNLVNERVTTFLTDVSSWRVCTFLKQDGISNDPSTFSYVMKTYERMCVNTKDIQIVWHSGFFLLINLLVFSPRPFP
jgi:hypothetical protein